MIKHILVPLDGSPLAECVLPHALSMASALGVRLSLLTVLNRGDGISSEAIDPLAWQLKKNEAQRYLDGVVEKLQAEGVTVQSEIIEGSTAKSIIASAEAQQSDLILLSSHGQGGLSEWNVSSVVHKVMMRFPKSTLLVRAHHCVETEEKVEYKRIFLGLDSSAQAEFVLPLASSLAKQCGAKLILGTVVRRPEIFSRFPLPPEKNALIEQVSAINLEEAEAYLSHLRTRLKVQGLEVETRVVVSDTTTVALLDLVDQTEADLVVLSAHGNSSAGRCFFGSVATSFIVYGNTSLIMMQNFSDDLQKGGAFRGSEE